MISRACFLLHLAHMVHECNRSGKGRGAGRRGSFTLSLSFFMVVSVCLFHLQLVSLIRFLQCILFLSTLSVYPKVHRNLRGNRFKEMQGILLFKKENLCWINQYSLKMRIDVPNCKIHKNVKQTMSNKKVRKRLIERREYTYSHGEDIMRKVYIG